LERKVFNILQLKQRCSEKEQTADVALTFFGYDDILL